MNKTIETIKLGNKVTTEELFEVVNGYVLTTLSLRTADNHTVMSMQVNEYKSKHDEHEFSQKCHGFSDVMYSLKKEDLVSVRGEYNKKADAFYVYASLKNGMKLMLMIVNVSGSEEEIESEGFYETDMYEIKDFLDDVIHEKNEWKIMLARITDVFGFDLKMRNPFRTYVNTLDESDWKLSISDDFTTFEVPIADDSINLLYMKESDRSKEIIVKPYGQPFMEVKLLFFKKN